MRGRGRESCVNVSVWPNGRFEDLTVRYDAEQDMITHNVSLQEGKM